MTLGEVAGTDLEPEGNTLELPVRAAPPEAGVGAAVEADPVPGGPQLNSHASTAGLTSGTSLTATTTTLWGQVGGQEESEVVAVGHHQRADSRADTPHEVCHTYSVAPNTSRK